MEFRRMKLSELKELPDNSNLLSYSKAELEEMVDSIKRYGLLQPIVVEKNTNYIVCGNNRYRSLLELKEEEVDVLVIDLSGDINEIKKRSAIENLIRKDVMANIKYRMINELLGVSPAVERVNSTESSSINLKKEERKQLEKELEEEFNKLSSQVDLGIDKKDYIKIFKHVSKDVRDKMLSALMEINNLTGYRDYIVDEHRHELEKLATEKKVLEEKINELINNKTKYEEMYEKAIEELKAEKGRVEQLEKIREELLNSLEEYKKMKIRDDHLSYILKFSRLIELVQVLSERITPFLHTFELQKRNEEIDIIQTYIGETNIERFIQQIIILKEKLSEIQRILRPNSEIIIENKRDDKTEEYLMFSLFVQKRNNLIDILKRYGYDMKKKLKNNETLTENIIEFIKCSNLDNKLYYDVKEYLMLRWSVYYYWLGFLDSYCQKTYQMSMEQLERENYELAGILKVGLEQALDNLNFADKTYIWQWLQQKSKQYEEKNNLVLMDSCECGSGCDQCSNGQKKYRIKPTFHSLSLTGRVEIDDEVNELSIDPIDESGTPEDEYISKEMNMYNWLEFARDSARELLGEETAEKIQEVIDYIKVNNKPPSMNDPKFKDTLSTIKFLLVSNPSFSLDIFKE